jgi:hypothetical protein
VHTRSRFGVASIVAVLLASATSVPAAASPPIATQVFANAGATLRYTPSRGFRAFHGIVSYTDLHVDAPPNGVIPKALQTKITATCIHQFKKAAAHHDQHVGVAIVYLDADVPGGLVNESQPAGTFVTPDGHWSASALNSAPHGATVKALGIYWNSDESARTLWLGTKVKYNGSNVFVTCGNFTKTMIQP